MSATDDIWSEHGQVDKSEGGSHFLGDFSKIPVLGTPSIVLASFVSNILALALPFAILIVYDRVIPNAANQTLTLIISGVAVALLIDALVRYSRSLLVMQRSAQYSHRAFLGGVARVLFADPRAFESESAARRLEQLSAVEVIRESRAGYLPQLIIDFPFFAVFLGAVFLIGNELGLILLACVVLLVIATLRNGIRVRNLVESRQKAERSQTNFLIEILSGITTIKTFSMERFMTRRYERVMQRSALITEDLAKATGGATAIANLLTQFSLVAIVGYGAMMAIDGAITIGGVAACMMLAGRAMQPLNRAALMWSQYQSVRIATKQIRDLTDMPLAASFSDRWLSDFRGGIRFDSVDFSYDPDRPLYKQLSVNIEPGEAVSVSADDWPGRSSMLALAAGIMRPDRGQVLYDGIDGTRLSDAHLRRAVAYLPQYPSLFQGTILDNITGFDTDPARVQRALDIAEELGLTEAVSKLAKGFSTPISTGAIDALPASLRQHIPICRELANDPMVLVMDECNSNLDQEADRSFRAALARRKGKMTIIMVSQRPSFLALCDRALKPNTEADISSDPASVPEPSELPHPVSVGDPDCPPLEPVASDTPGTETAAETWEEDDDPTVPRFLSQPTDTGSKS